MIDKESILSKTHYGLSIYTHILRLYYPNEVILRLVERDCGFCRNPFNSNKETLHIFICKENVLGNVLDKEFARHEDSENTIPAGDVFDFAELHYKQQGDELLQTLNREMDLRIGEKYNFYTKKQISVTCPPCPKSPYVPYSPLFSFFKAPISNTKPHSETTLQKVYNAIVGNYYKERTEKLRAILAAPLSCGEGLGERSRKFKAVNFDYCTFSGTFTARSDKALIKHSGLLCVDFDHLQSVDTLRNQLLQDEYFDTQLLFVSPSGKGLKWIIQITPPLNNLDILGIFSHNDYFTAIANYILQTYDVEVDKSGRDISRACFLPHDPDAYINPQHLKK